MAPVRKGDKAPAFSLPGTGGATYSLSQFRGKSVVLVFYPGDETTICTLQLQSYSTDISAFRDLDAVVLGISPQDVASHEAFKANRELEMELLADSDKSVAEAYGVLGPLGFYRRSIIVIDRDGIIQYTHRGVTGASFQPSSRLLKVLESLSPGSAA